MKNTSASIQRFRRIAAAVLLVVSLLAGGTAHVTPANAYTEVGKGKVTAQYSFSYKNCVRSKHWAVFRYNDGCRKAVTGKWAMAFHYSKADTHGQPVVDYSAYWGTYSI